ncbi:MAG: hypothetical protein RLZZ59_145 [Pseudomonadota bacterium]
MTNIIEIKDRDFAIRLDRFLRTINPFLTQGVIEQYLRKGLIKVNEKKAESSLRLINGDKIFVADSIEDQLKPRSRKLEVKNTPIVSKLAQKLLSEYLVYDHEAFVAVNKPSGLASQGGTKITLSLDDALVYLSDQGVDLRLVHRLDKDTSGIILIAKSSENADRFMKAFQKHKIHKTYMAILSSVPQKSKGRIESYLIKEKDFEVSTYEEEVEGSKVAVTEYEIIKIINDKALVKFYPLTGRMHQLRVHSKLIGCPIVGDEKYGGVESDKLMLHAAAVLIDKDVFGEEIQIACPIPEYFNICL